MPRSRRIQLLPALAGIVLGMFMPTGHAGTTIADPGAFLAKAESLHRKDHERFVQMLAQIHREMPPMSPHEQWTLRYLDAWETMFEGNYGRSESQLRDIAEHSGDRVLATKALALLLTNLGVNQRYEEAFALANRLASELPRIRDSTARYTVLMNLSQMLDLAGQVDLAIRYARMTADAMPAGESQCLPLSLQIAALYNGKRLRSSSPEIGRGINACVADQQRVVANTIWLVLGSVYLDENQPGKTIALLDRIDASINANHYFPHVLSSQAERAQAYAKLGDDNGAKKAALAAVALGHPGDVSEWLMVAYEVLYRIEKKQGHSAAALAYYEQYVTQNKGFLNDINARTLAYEMAQQHMLVQKFDTESLSKQNNILRLQEALATKAMETGRLYIALLLVVMASIIYWLFRLKRSQLRFKRLSSLDGLTGIFNHQHFISEADRALRMLEKKRNAACLIAIDLDHFKQLNDTYGHAFGDAVLKHTVALCKQYLRPADVFGRLGGEEFGVLLLDCAHDQGMVIADRIRSAIEATPLDIDGHSVPYSASLGLAFTDTSGYDLQRLCRDADAALYRAKRMGRNRVVADNESDDLVEA